MRIKNMMKKKVITVSPGDSIVSVLRLFSKNNISGAPVMDGKRVAGIITDSDIIANLDMHTPKVHFASSPDFLLILAGLKSRKGMDEIEREMRVMKRFLVEDFMVGKVFTLDPNDTMTNAAKIMNRRGINRIPVVDKKGRLVGIVARQDIIRALTKC